MGRQNEILKGFTLLTQKINALYALIQGLGGGGGATHQQDVFWAEENGGISANQDEYSWGNGATGNIGIPCPYDGFEATSMLIQAETKPSVGTAQIMLKIGGSNTTHIVTFTERDQVIDLPSPVSISKGTRIGFRTVAVSGGTWSDVRVGVVGRFPLLTI